ncbi:MAG: hypothetical protein LUD69_07710 [Oscillospiraceae bacterium]|nr:hypothetical protein [Oscillospiraceae bacterium]MCD8376815.1 hypothetical protein [Oscillospiraceae bacterium]
MNQSSNLDALLQSQQARRLLDDKQTLERLMRSGEAQQLLQLLDKKAQGGLKNAAQDAMGGNQAQLQTLLEGLLRDPKGARLVEQLNQKAGQ